MKYQAPKLTKYGKPNDFIEAGSAIATFTTASGADVNIFDDNNDGTADKVNVDGTDFTNFSVNDLSEFNPGLSRLTSFDSSGLNAALNGGTPRNVAQIDLDDNNGDGDFLDPVDTTDVQFFDK